MKELSIEEKAKAYDGVREKIAIRFGSNVADEIFSQFEMSEDERIRKDIVEAVELHKDFTQGRKERIYAWLEKQGERKPAEWNIFDFRTWQYIVSDVLTKKDGIGQYLDSGECKKIAQYMQEEWSKKLSVEKMPELLKGEDYGIDGLYAAVDILQKTLGKVDGYQTDDGILEHKCAISAVNELSKQKSAWSEVDEKMLKACTELVGSTICANYGEEDGVTIESCRNWLKFLKERYTWKPSGEQMLALDSAIHCYAGISPTNNREVYALEIMKEQLKKLRGE